MRATTDTMLPCAAIYGAGSVGRCCCPLGYDWRTHPRRVASRCQHKVPASAQAIAKLAVRCRLTILTWTVPTLLRTSCSYMQTYQGHNYLCAIRVVHHVTYCVRLRREGSSEGKHTQPDCGMANCRLQGHPLTLQQYTSSYAARVTASRMVTVMP